MTRRLLAVLFLTLTACAPHPEVDVDPASRANDLAQRTIIFDGHIDLPYRLFDAETPEALDTMLAGVVEGNDEGNFDFPRARKGGLDAPFMSIYVPAGLEDSGRAKTVADELIDLVERLASSAPDKFAVATSASQVRENFRQDRLSLLLGMENGAPLEGSLENLRHFYGRGVRYITLAHSKDNHICDSSYDDRHTWGGLSPFGREVVAEMNKLGVMIDISHLSDDAASQVLDLSLAPVIASHSSCRRFTPGFERNLSDELLARLPVNGGVIMINFGSSFLRADIRERTTAARDHSAAWAQENGLEAGDEKAREYRREYFRDNPPGYADVSDVADHIMHAVEISGIDHVGLGSDFDGVGDSLPTELKDVSHYPNLLRELLERGLDEEAVQKICSGNILRVMDEIEAAARELRPLP